MLTVVLTIDFYNLHFDIVTFIICILDIFRLVKFDGANYVEHWKFCILIKNGATFNYLIAYIYKIYTLYKLKVSNNANYSYINSKY